MVSSGSDGEAVKVVGGDRPGVPGAHPVLAFEPGSVESVFAFEVAEVTENTKPGARGFILPACGLPHRRGSVPGDAVFAATRVAGGQR
jgi:hypothetical protein